MRPVTDLGGANAGAGSEVIQVGLHDAGSRLEGGAQGQHIRPVHPPHAGHGSLQAGQIVLIRPAADVVCRLVLIRLVGLQIPRTLLQGKQWASSGSQRKPNVTSRAEADMRVWACSHHGEPGPDAFFVPGSTKDGPGPAGDDVFCKP